jgi:hypothetical protein
MLSINIQTLPRGNGSAEGMAQNAISKLVRGPTESDAVPGELYLLDSYTTSASESKKRVTRVLRDEQLKSLRYFCHLQFPPNFIVTLARRGEIA